jgi:hypothetical protein
MTKTTTNLLLMIITILAGIYFYVNYCNSCGMAVKEDPIKEAVKAPLTPEDGKAKNSRTVVTLN